MNQNKVGNFIKELRKERELTQEQMAEKLGTSHFIWVYRIQNTQTDPVSRGMGSVLIQETYYGHHKILLRTR